MTPSRRGLCLLLTFAISPLAAAQVMATATPTEGFARSPASDKSHLGWNDSATLSGNLSFSSSQDVVGQTDGNSQTYGTNLKAAFIRLGEQDEWRNTGSLLESTSRTPSLPQFIKASDELKLESVYLYSLAKDPDWGPYAKVQASAPIFAGEDVRPAPVTYQISTRGQAPTTFTGTSLRLTDGLHPLNTRESVGAFWKAIQRDDFKLEFRLGLGALQVAADGQYAVQGTNANGTLQVNELQDLDQVGVEAAAGLKGKVNDNSGYEAGLETLTPLVTNKPSDNHQDNLALTNVDGFVKLTSKFNSWMSFSYDYKLKIEPQLLDRAQQIHLLVLNLNYNLL